MIGTDRQLPPGWKWARLGDLCDFIRGVSFQPGDVRTADVAGYVPILRAGNIQDTLDLLHDLIWVPKERVSKEQELRSGDLVICMSSGSPKVVGKTAQLKHHWSGSAGAFCGIVRARSGVTPDYLAFWFRSPSYIAWRDYQARGSNIQNLRFSQLEPLEIPLPPLEEQKRIAAILNEQMAAVEKARAAAEARLEAAKSLPTAYLRWVFNSPEAARWPKRRLGDILKVQSGAFLPAKAMNPKGKCPVYGGNGINGYHDQFMFEDAQLVIGRVGALCGCIHITERKSWITDNALYVSEKYEDFDNRFMAAALTYLDINKMANSMAQPLVTGKLLYSLEVSLPSLETQKRMADSLLARTHAGNEVIAATTSELETVNALPASLLHQAFNGEL